MPPVTEIAPNRSPEIGQDMQDIVQDLVPVATAIEVSAAGDRRDFAQREAALDSEVRERVNQHVSRMDARDITRSAEQMLQNPDLDPAARQALKESLQNVNQSTQPLRDILFTALTESEQKSLRSFDDLSPAAKQRAQENLRTLLEGASDAKLAELYDGLGIHSDPPAQTRAERLDALMKSNLLERSFNDPRTAIELSNLLGDSGKLTPQMSEMLRELTEKARETIEQLREKVCKEFIKLIREYIEQSVRQSLSRESASSSFVIDTDIKWTWYVDFLQALEREKDGIALVIDKKPQEELLKALAQQDDALRERDKKEDRAEEQAHEDRQALKREIQRMARANPEIFNRMCGMAAEQIMYLDPMTVAHRIPEFQSSLG